MKDKPASLAVQPSGARPESPIDVSMSIRVDWRTHDTNQYPDIKDAFLFETVTLYSMPFDSAYGGPESSRPAVATWQPLSDPFQNGIYPLSTAGTLSFYSYSDQQHPYHCDIDPASISGADTESPDYGAIYMVSYFRVGDYVPSVDPVPTLNAGTLPYVALYKTRVWTKPSAIITGRSGDGQHAVTNSFFETPLSVKVTDSTGSTQGTHGMAVRFEIMQGGASFDTGGYNQRLVTVSDGSASNTAAWVFSEYGTAFAPRIKAGSTAQNILIRAYSQFAVQPYYFNLTVVDRTGPADAAFVSVAEGDYQDQLESADFPIQLRAKVETKLRAPAATGTVQFVVYPAVAGQEVSALFSGSTTVSQPVEEGYVVAPTLSTANGSASPSGYTANIVCAAPESFDWDDSDPRTDATGAVARFTERVWSGRVAILRKDASKDGQTTAPGQFFASRLTATTLDAAQQAVARMLVTFTLQGPGQFDHDDDVPVEDWSQKVVTVRSDGDGLATAPRIQAVRGQEGAITVTLGCLVSDDQPVYAIKSVIPPDEGVSVGLQAGDMQDQVLDKPFAFPMSVSVKNAQGNNATAGSVTFTCQATADATGNFNGANSVTANVHDGMAIAPATLQGATLPQQTESYGYFEVAAETDHTPRPYVFRQRVWRSAHAILEPVSGGSTDNKTKPGDRFPIPVVAHVKGPNAEDIQDLLVTFTLQGPAEFVYDSSPEQVGDSEASASVRTDKHGLAQAPGIRALMQHGAVTVTANVTVAQNPLPYSLTVLPPKTDAFYVYVDPATDLQAALAAQPYASPLSVSVKTSAGDAATTGTVTFKVFNVGATAFFPKESDHTQCVAQVTNGRATTSTLSAGGITGSQSGIFRVVAYPTEFAPNDPKTDTSDQSAHFTEQVWSQKYLALTKQEGDAQHTSINQFFSAHLTVQATDQSNRNAAVAYYLVTFSIPDPTYAAFDMNDTDPDVDIVTGTSQSVTVRGSPTGFAKAPRILAGANARSFQVQAQGTVDQGASFQLTIDTAAQTKIYTLTPDPTPTIEMDADDNDFASFILKQNGVAVTTGVEVTLTIAPPGVACFSPTDPSVLSKVVTTTSRGEARHEIWSGDAAGTATVTASAQLSSDGSQKFVVGDSTLR
ncbi:MULTISPECIES: hypothetical protein [unclassified Achromobacter]|uniref:hypothetical protein n=1 Tax=unclassified Achromobacter TaxID=2626865 RepID=UPI001178ACD2|nr:MULTISPECIES: hypothetical protein [unclassified Achromobacter]